jgi:hypothetical protein
MHQSSESIGAIATAKAQAELVIPQKTLFTLVGIAGEDDLDAPDLVQPPEPPRLEHSVVRKPSNGNGSLHSSRLPPLAPDCYARRLRSVWILRPSEPAPIRKANLL